MANVHPLFQSPLFASFFDMDSHPDRCGQRKKKKKKKNHPSYYYYYPDRERELYSNNNLACNT